MTARGAWRWAIGVAVLAFVPFWPALDAQFTNWDDQALLLVNERWRGFSGESLAWMFGSTFHGHYQPLTWLSYAVDHACCGLDPAAFHRTNLLLHALNAVLVFWVLRLLRPGRVPAWIAAVGALLFAVHPLRVEVVAWVTERRMLLAAAFWLVAVGLYLRAHQRSPSGRVRDLVLVYGSMTLSLFAAGWAMTLPVVLLVLDFRPLQRRARGVSWRRLLVEKLPALAVVGAFALVAIAAQSEAGARISYDDHTLIARCAQAAYSLVFYLGATVVPLNLAPLYPLEHALDVAEFRFVGSVVLVLGVAVALVLCRRRTPWPGGLGAAAIVYVVVLSPVLGFAQSGPQLAADRYTYLAGLVLPALLVCWPAAIARPRVTGLTAAAVLVVFAVLTYRQAGIWRDSIRLWEHTIALQPGSFNAHLNYAGALKQRGGPGDAERALAEFRRTVELQPNEFKAWTAIGAAEYRGGNFAASLAAYTRAHELVPGSAAYLHGMAIATFELGRFDDCVRLCEQCHAVDPSWPHAWAVLAEALARLGRHDEAQRARSRVRR